MRSSRSSRSSLLALAAAALASTACENPHEPTGWLLFASPQARPIALSPDGTRLYAVNTTGNSLTVIDTASSQALVPRLHVGLDPVSVAVRPDGKEVWVANHVSDSVSVVDTDPASATLHHVIATIQDLDANGATLFDEPVGIAFASNAKAYVALSSRNEVAVVDIGASSYDVRAQRIQIAAQDPRDIAVRGGRLYVAAFESGNTSEISACPNGNSPPECTIGESDLVDFGTSPNLPHLDKNILKDGQMPDRDVFVFDTSDESPVDVVSGVGTLLYGLAVDSGGDVFVALTDARNVENGLQGDALGDLENRLFLNQIARIDCSGPSCSFSAGSDVIDLEPLPPADPAPGDQLATPYGIALSADDGTAVVTAAASSRIFTLDTATGSVRDILDVGAIPRGVALHSNPSTNAPETAYVLNTLDSTVSVVDVSDPDALAILATLSLGSDPTPEAVRRGRIAFNSANASSTGTFACASCHPDAHTDQLMWRIGGACDPSFDPGCGDDEARSTMPIRGLAGTLPLHWDGTLGDPFGGGNGAVGPGGSGGSDCSLGGIDGDHDCFLDLADASLSGVMCDQAGACPPGGVLSAGERDDMAHFLASVSYPPARSRRMDDSLSGGAQQGVRDFFTDQGGIANFIGIATCADMDSGCHALPLGTATNSVTVGGFEAPTMRGMTDRFLLFSLGHTATRDNLEFFTAWNPASDGPDEFRSFESGFPGNLAGFTDAYNVLAPDIFQMFEEASTGTSGALGRQVTLSFDTLTGGSRIDTLDLWEALEAADDRGVVNFRGRGLFVTTGTTFGVSYLADQDLYQVGMQKWTPAELDQLASSGLVLATLTAYHPAEVGDAARPQPLLAPVSTGSGSLGNPDLPILPGDDPIALAAIDVQSDARVLVDGQPVGASVTCTGGAFAPGCTSGVVEIDLDQIPANGLHLLQVQSGPGLLSNELPICAGPVGGCN